SPTMTGLQPNIFVGIAIPWGLATLALICRVIARRMKKVVWGYEDYFCFVAFVFTSFFNSLCVYWTTNWSLGVMIPDSVDPVTRQHILEMSRKIAFFCSISYAFAIGFCKLAILSLYWRLFKITSIRIPIIILYVLSIIWIIIRLPVVLFRCSPVQAYWDKTIPGGHCKITDGVFFFATMLPHIIMDIIILILPLIEILKLHLRPAQKIATATLFLFGITQVKILTYTDPGFYANS
ncbi:unnamed protein product, partial [Clonostachys rhizophaga]